MGAKSTWIPDTQSENPFNKNLKEYDRIIGEQCKENRTWRRIAIISLCAFFLSLGIVIYAVNLPKTVPLVITVSDWGEAKYVGGITQYSYANIQVPEIAVHYQLRKFVTNINTITSDPDVMRQNIRECYAAMIPTSADKLTRILREDNPLQEYGTIKRQISIESVLRLSDSSYQIDFIETDSRSDGFVRSRTRCRAVCTTALMEPAVEDLIMNPLGIYITDFDITTIGEIQ